jgi:serine/threonine protein phosphatase PrpC
MRVRAWQRTDPGLVRKQNEDASVLLQQFGIFAVCDGCGGRKGGQQASTLASRKIAEEGARLVQTFADYHAERDRELRGQILQQIARIFDEASAEIYANAQVLDMPGMATTSILLALIDTSGFIGHVGDSRLYLLRRNKIYQLTEDHSLFQKLVNAGKLEPKDYDRFPYKHVISRSLGSEPTVETDTLFVDLQPGDVFVICSDGVSDLVKPVEMLNISHFEGPEKLCDRLTELVLERGAHDNATTVVVQVLDNEPEPGAEPGARPRRDSRTIDLRPSPAKNRSGRTRDTRVCAANEGCLVPRPSKLPRIGLDARGTREFAQQTKGVSCPDRQSCQE